MPCICAYMVEALKFQVSDQISKGPERHEY